MKINPRLALVGLACLTLNMACGSKDEKASFSRAKTTKVETQDKSKSETDGDAKEALDFAEVEIMGPPDFMSPPAPAAQKAETESELTGPPSYLAHMSAKAAADSEEIKKSPSLRIAFADLKGLIEISQKKDSAILGQAVIQASDAEIVSQLKKMNEENICRVSLKGQLHKDDYLEFADHKMTEIDKAEDIYKTEFKFKNANSEVAFICTHTTYNFYVESFYTNLQKWITVYNLENTPVVIKDFVNPRTENRILNAIKIANIEAFEKVIMSDARPKMTAMFNGAVVDMDDASNEVANGSGTLSCAIPWVIGKPTTDKIYIRVEKGVAEETPSEVRTGTIFAIYRADANHFFAMTCLAKKTASWADLMTTAKGILTFGVLERPEYSKKYDEVLEIHKEFQAKHQ